MVSPEVQVGLYEFFFRAGYGIVPSEPYFAMTGPT
jgi:hypothetical protein